MKQLLPILILFCLTIAACQPKPAKYGLDVLQGDWQRLTSSDPRSDSMMVNVNNDIAKVLSTMLPTTSDFVVGQNKWTNITSISEGGDFQLLDLSAAGSSYEAVITMNSDSSLELVSTGFPDAPGGEQSLIKK